MSKIDSKLKFPVSYELRVIMETQEKDEQNIEAIRMVLEKIRIPHKDWGMRKSGEGTYTSYSVKVMVKDHSTLKLLYQELNSVPGVKHAI